MAAGAGAAVRSGGTVEPAVNGTESSVKPIERSIRLTQLPGVVIHVHLTIYPASVMLFLTNSSMESSSAAAALGSFVYAIPDRYNPQQPLSTTIYSMPSTLDFTTRMAKLVAKKLRRPCYVGNSINLSGAVGGGTVEEEMEAFSAISNLITSETA